MMMRVSCHILALLAETLSYCCGHRSWDRKVANVYGRWSRQRAVIREAPGNRVWGMEGGRSQSRQHRVEEGNT